MFQSQTPGTGAGTSSDSSVMGSSAKFSPESFLATVEAVMETDWLANLSNFAALVKTEIQGLNWAGFYLMKYEPEELVLGPFQGNPACIRIRLGKGVCGTAALENRTVVVEDVDQFPGHIVCDLASKSEIVIPFVIDGSVRGVLDVDAPTLSRFDKITAETLEKAVKILVSKTTWPSSF